MLYLSLGYGLLALFVSLIFTPFFRMLALRLGVVDAPDGKIKVHEKITPYLGGVAVFCVAIPILFLTGYFHEMDLVGILLGLSILMAVGVIDDIFTIKPSQKLVGQALAAVVFIISGSSVCAPYIPTYVAYSLTFFWFMLFSNALNLVDIMDGLAGSISLYAFISFGFLAYGIGNSYAILFSSILVGSLLGFLYYNRPRAKIYLGDAGSLFLGGCLSIMPFLLAKNSGFNVHELLTSFIILGIPLAETGILIIIRTYKGIPFYKGSPDHFACFLRKKGWSESKILGFVFLLSISLGFVARCFFWGIISHFATLASLVILLFFSILTTYFD